MHLLCGSSRAMKRAHGGWQRRNSMALHREENKVPLRQSPKCKWIIARVVVGSEIATTKGNVTASWRQRNLRSGWRVRQYDLTTSLRQRRRCAISQWIAVILYGFTQWAFPMRKATQCWVTYEREQINPTTGFSQLVCLSRWHYLSDALPVND